MVGFGLRCCWSLALLRCVWSLEASFEVEELVSAASHLLDIDGRPIPLEMLSKGPALITNVASECSETDANYRQLAELQKSFGDRGLNVLLFPCNQFGNQEPGSAAEIKAFARGFGPDLTLMSKVEVNGPGADPLWRFLKGRLGGGDIEWNFSTKFLLQCTGRRCKAARFEGKMPASLLPVIERALEMKDEPSVEEL
eukprot:TRINITY_DN57984_c0_g1_i1.p1 TRINITY_DN57984_c0_g1~~TRINITY_DN57984_c0_g1_i1.p1  ORF type:complete len:204 (-),score=57.67 TRINITY_DN57984_c0_g1_i1:77-667(-)